jgi:hypothetical protein
MGGVDQHDYLRMARYSVQTAHVFKKWYKLFFLAMLDMTLVNSYILWKLSIGDSNKLTHAQFQEQVALGLVDVRLNVNGIRTRRAKSPMATPVPATHSHRRHEIAEGYAGRDKRYKRCFVCGAEGKKAFSEFSCDKCGVSVCMRPKEDGSFCWLKLHNDQEIMEKVRSRLAAKRKRGNMSMSPRTMRRRRRSVQEQPRTGTARRLVV